MFENTECKLDAAVAWCNELADALRVANTLQSGVDAANATKLAE